MGFSLARFLHVHVFSLALLLLAPAVDADIRDVQVTDVTDRAFSVVWAADEVVKEAKIRVFRDASGLSEITPLKTRLVSAEIAGAHSAGFGKMDVYGLDPATIYYFQLQNVSDAAISYFPQAAPFAQVVTADAKRVSDADGRPIRNPLLVLPASSADSLSPATGTLVVVNVSGFSVSPISTFLDHSKQNSAVALIDLNNLYAKGNSAFSADQVITLTEYSGFKTCPELTAHRIIRYRKASPANLANPELLTLVRCTQHDLDCSGAVDQEDLQRLSSYLGTRRGTCGYHDEMDLDANGLVDEQDAQAVSDAIN